MADYLSTNSGGLLVWAQNFVKCIKAKNASLKIDSKTISELEALTERYRSALEKANDPEHTRMDKVRKNEAARDLRKKIRFVVQSELRFNSGMTPEFRAEMMLNEPKPRVKNNAVKITVSPVLEVIISKGRVRVRYIDGTTGRRAKPKGVRGIQYKYGILDTPPRSVADLTGTVSKSSGELDLEFVEEERGKALYISAAWENSHGDTGPWSEIIKVYIS